MIHIKQIISWRKLYIHVLESLFEFWSADIVAEVAVILTWVCPMYGVYSVKRDVMSRTLFSLRDVTSRPMFATPRDY
jgi:hypothetical protein